MRFRGSYTRLRLLGGVGVAVCLVLVLLSVDLGPRVRVLPRPSLRSYVQRDAPSVSFPRADPVAAMAAAVASVSTHRTVPEVPSIVVHLDLKGSPPTMIFLRYFLQLVANEGADGLLIEYEDMFPFEGRLANISARNAYTKEEIKQILVWAKEAGLHVIPLVQTFGHMEYVLKLAEFRHFRELQSFPQSLCPSHPDTMGLVQDILQQVMALHTPDVRFLHIGCDEVYHLKACGRCSQRPSTARDLFMSHVSSVARLVRSTFPGVTPLIWDDMLRDGPLAKLANSKLSKLVEPVVWNYHGNLAPIVSNIVWYTYGRTFPRLWAAAAYRGASGPAAPAPDLETRLNNVIAWRRRQLQQGNGEPAPAPAVLVLTGWARYDHMAVLTELLPTSVPSLVLLLQVARGKRLPETNREKKRLLDVWKRSLGCPNRLSDTTLESEPYQWHLSKCSFLGVDVFNAVGYCEYFLNSVKNLEEDTSQKLGWVSAYHRARGWSNPSHALYVSDKARMLSQRLRTCANNTRTALLPFADEHTVAEWLEQRVAPAQKAMEELERDATRLSAGHVWPRRPVD